MPIPHSTISKIVAERDSVEYQLRGKVIDEWAAHLRLHPSTVRRHIQKYEGKTRTYSREPDPHYRDVALQVLSYKQRIAAHNGGREPSTRRALTELRRDGQIQPPIPSTSTVNNLISTLAPGRQTTPHVLMTAEYPNQVWNIDLSVSKMLVPGPEPGTVVVKSAQARHKESYTGKIWCVAAKDKYSGCTYVRYAHEMGESAKFVLGFLHDLFSRSTDVRYPFGGLPDIMVSDNGSFGKSAMAVSACAQLGIDLTRIKPYNSRANGSIENKWSYIFRDFEGPQFVPRLGEIIELDEVNCMLYDWFVSDAHLPSTENPRLSRMERWRKIEMLGDLRFISPNARFGAVYEERVVSDAFTVQYNNVLYEVPQVLPRGKKVTLFIGWENEPFAVVDPDSGELYEVKPYEKVVIGNFRSLRKSDTERRLEEIEENNSLPVPSAVDHSAPGDVIPMPKPNKSKDKDMEARTFKSLDKAVKYVSGLVINEFSIPLPDVARGTIERAIGNDLSVGHVTKVAKQYIDTVKENMQEAV